MPDGDADVNDNDLIAQLLTRVEELTDEVARLRPIAKAAVELRLDAGRERAATEAAEARERALRQRVEELERVLANASSRW